ncbi:hypothetical protein DMC30DRAFT_31868 [Rhodotorula diobovata]|uniref:Uncharacterized protein n=1 Tax=Rhodotorula diobovata TaxID=5288 RepID=A0A5C5FRI6_9BASI|nr:hypothetical protein DMC30DRAFT_31868 [Rhodotorula diobovata]
MLAQRSLEARRSTCRACPEGLRACADSRSTSSPSTAFELLPPPHSQPPAPVRGYPQDTCPRSPVALPGAPIRAQTSRSASVTLWPSSRLWLSLHGPFLTFPLSHCLAGSHRPVRMRSKPGQTSPRARRRSSRSGRSPAPPLDAVTSPRALRATPSPSGQRVVRESAGRRCGCPGRKDDSAERLDRVPRCRPERA